MTMKQLVEDLTPFQDGGRVWSGEKKTTIYAINGKSGKIMRIFQTGGGPQKVMDERCKAKDLDDLEDECDSNESKKTILLGRTGTFSLS